jgi:DNA-binding response OmpR family regulator
VAGDGASILIVEDDAALRMVCRVTLELERFRVREAGAVDEARAAVADERPALVFLDVHLGPTASDVLLEELRADGIPVVIVSGTSELDDYVGRASDIIGKPFDPARLVAAARRHLVG